MKKRTKKLLLITPILLLVFIIASRQLMPRVRSYLNRQELLKQNEETIQKKDLPTSAYLEVPFICQAPLQTEANWVYHEESCEEAALLQAYLYETNQTITPQQAHERILNMIDWQIKNFGSHHDIYADELKEFAAQYYEINPDNITVIYDTTIEDIKEQINQNHPVIVPITGNILKNPYYPYPGYHMLTVIGYTEDRIITNDNGTRHGQDFSYDNTIFQAAMDDAGGDIVVLEL